MKYFHLLSVVCGHHIIFMMPALRLKRLMPVAPLPTACVFPILPGRNKAPLPYAQTIPLGNRVGQAVSYDEPLLIRHNGPNADVVVNIVAIAVHRAVSVDICCIVVIIARRAQPPISYSFIPVYQ